VVDAMCAAKTDRIPCLSCVIASKLHTAQAAHCTKTRHPEPPGCRFTVDNIESFRCWDDAATPTIITEMKVVLMAAK
jgi:hypothetical protein